MENAVDPSKGLLLICIFTFNLEVRFYSVEDYYFFFTYTKGRTTTNMCTINLYSAVIFRVQVQPCIVDCPFKADKLLKSTTDGDKLFHTDTTLSAK